jgi:hypothetical protein
MAMATPGAALGEPASYGPLEIEWQAPAECPDRAGVVDRVRALAPSPPPRAEVVHVRATAARDVDGFHVVLETRQGVHQFQRRIEAHSCDALADAAALTMALTIDPELRAHAEPAAAISSPGAAPPPSMEALPPPPPEAGSPPPGTESKSSTSVGAGLEGVIDTGTLPRAAVGLRPSVELVLRGMHLGLAFLWLLPNGGTLASNANKGGNIGLVGGAARFCLTLWDRRVALDGCAGAELGRLHGEPFGVNRPTPIDRWWFAPELAALARLPTAERIAIVGGGALVVPVSRPVFVLENVGTEKVSTVHQPSTVSGRLEIGLAAHFP